MSEKIRSHAGWEKAPSGSEERKDMPKSVFLDEANRKYPVKTYNSETGKYELSDKMLRSAISVANFQGDKAISAEASRLLAGDKDVEHSIANVGTLNPPARNVGVTRAEEDDAVMLSKDKHMKHEDKRHVKHESEHDRKKRLEHEDKRHVKHESEHDRKKRLEHEDKKHVKHESEHDRKKRLKHEGGEEFIAEHKRKKDLEHEDKKHVKHESEHDRKKRLKHEEGEEFEESRRRDDDDEIEHACGNKAMHRGKLHHGSAPGARDHWGTGFGSTPGGGSTNTW